MNKQYLKDQIGRFVAIYELKLKPVFDNIDIEAEEHGNKFFEEALQYSHPDAIDRSDIAEAAMDRAYKHWDLLNHGKYVLLASWHVALYEAFEQQVRSYLFKELSHDYRFELRQFLSKFKDFKKVFLLYGVDLKSLQGLKQIEQLGLLCNVIKHGDGNSAIELRRKRPDLFKMIDDAELLDIFGSSLLEEALAISEATLIQFGKEIEAFWDSFPERSFCDETDKLMELLNKQ